ncbi:MAG: calcium-translocating P-type ATPase, PMCA-type [Bacillota bacterium]|nr:calcium-translocating P-type ATPase, PMCA-type [Bacillota bacterium]
MALWYSQPKEEIEKTLETNLKTGLTVKQAEEHLQKHGKNKLPEQRKKTAVEKFLSQFTDPTIIVLLVAAIICIAIGEIVDGIIICSIVIINAVIGLVQEQKAESALESIRKMTSPKAKVIRDGSQLVIDCEDVALGDLVVMEAGDYVPADVRITKCFNMKADESSLTGESVPVEKTDTVLSNEKRGIGDMTNMAFMSTVVTYGRAYGVVTETGAGTEIGKVANLLSGAEKNATPLQRRLKELSKILSIFALAVCVTIFIIGYLQSHELMTVFLNSLSLAVAAIPEGLPAIVTVVLAIGMQRMVKKNAIMKSLPAIETSGSATVICSDKTGTLTQNKMTVVKSYVNFDYVTASDISIEGTAGKFLTFGVLCNDTSVKKESEKYESVGDPTEVALIDAAVRRGMNPIEIKELNKRVEEIAFDSDRKLMTTVNKMNGELISITKGAPDVLLQRCTAVEDDSGVSPIDDEFAKKIAEANEEMSKSALRVIAVAYKKIESDMLSSVSTETLENDLIFVGLFGMIDPPREEAKKAIEKCKTAGIRPIMITGDHVITASAIARDLGILGEGDMVMSGAELEEISDEELTKNIHSYSVFARVSPEHKLRIVKALKANGHVTVMTGDGVNDAPALKLADIGVSMGVTGTEVAKGAADMILADDNFATIVSAVSYGRVIYDNIRKAIHFLLSSNIGEIISILLTTLLGTLLFSMPVQMLSAVQILWINLVTDSLLAIALGMEKAEPGIMNRPPRKLNESIFSSGLGLRIAFQGVLIGCLTFFAYYIGFKEGVASGTEIASRTGSTMAFMTLAFIQFFHVFNARSMNYSIFKIGIFSNLYVVGAFVINVILQLVTICIPAVRTSVFRLELISPVQWAIVIALSLTPVAVVEMQKAFSHILKKQ